MTAELDKFICSYGGFFDYLNSYDEVMTYWEFKITEELMMKYY